MFSFAKIRNRVFPKEKIRSRKIDSRFYQNVNPNFQKLSFFCFFLLSSFFVFVLLLLLHFFLGKKKNLHIYIYFFFFFSFLFNFNFSVFFFPSVESRLVFPESVCSRARLISAGTNRGSKLSSGFCLKRRKYLCLRKNLIILQHVYIWYLVTR